MSEGLRYLLASIAVTVLLTLLAIAFPNASRDLTIPGAVVAFGFTLYFLWPEIKAFHVKRGRPVIPLIGMLGCVIGLFGFAAWYWASPTGAPSFPFEVSLDEAGKEKLMPLIGKNQAEYGAYIGAHMAEVPVYHLTVKDLPPGQCCPEYRMRIYVKNLSDRDFPDARVTFIPTTHDLFISSSMQEAKISLSYDPYFERQVFRRYEISGVAQIYFLNVGVLNRAGSATMTIAIEPTNEPPFAAVMHFEIRRTP